MFILINIAPIFFGGAGFGCSIQEGLENRNFSFIWQLHARKICVLQNSSASLLQGLKKEPCLPNNGRKIEEGLLAPDGISTNHKS